MAKVASQLIHCARCDWTMGARTLAVLIQVGEDVRVVHTWKRCYSIWEDKTLQQGQIAADRKHVEQLEGNAPFRFPR